MTAEPARRGLLDTNIMILRSRIAPEELPDEMAISAVTLAELSAGPHEVRPDTELDAYFEAAERARLARRQRRALPWARPAHAGPHARGREIKNAHTPHCPKRSVSPSPPSCCPSGGGEASSGVA